MAEMLILDFAGLDEADYRRVNAALGLDPDSGAGAWPAGLITHVTGTSEDGHAFVVEVWESREAQADFMASRLGAAMAEAGVTVQPQVTWAGVIGHQNPGL